MALSSHAVSCALASCLLFVMLVSATIESMGVVSVKTSYFYEGTDTMTFTIPTKTHMLAANYYFNMTLPGPNWYFSKCIDGSCDTLCTSSDGVEYVTDWPVPGPDTGASPRLIKIYFPTPNPGSATDTTPVGSEYTISCTNVKMYNSTLPFNAAEFGLSLHANGATLDDPGQLLASADSLTFSPLYVNPKGTVTVSVTPESTVPLSDGNTLTLTVAIIAPSGASMIKSTATYVELPSAWPVSASTCAVSQVNGATDAASRASVSLTFGTKSGTSIPTVTATISAESGITGGFAVRCTNLATPAFSPAVASAVATVNAYNTATFTAAAFSYPALGRLVGTFALSTESPVVTASTRVTVRVAKLAGSYTTGTLNVLMPSGFSSGPSFSCESQTQPPAAASQFSLNTVSFTAQGEITARYAPASGGASVTDPQLSFTCGPVILPASPIAQNSANVIRVFNAASTLLAASNTGTYAGTRVNTDFAVKVVTTTGVAGTAAGDISIQLSGAGVSLAAGSKIVFGVPAPSTFVDRNAAAYSTACLTNNSPNHSYMRDASGTLTVTLASDFSPTVEIFLKCSGVLRLPNAEAPKGSMSVTIQSLSGGNLATVGQATLDTPKVAPSAISGVAALPESAGVGAASELRVRISSHFTGLLTGDTVSFGTPLTTAQSGKFTVAGVSGDAGDWTSTVGDRLTLTFTGPVALPAEFVVPVMLPASAQLGSKTYLFASTAAGARYAYSDAAMTLPVLAVPPMGSTTARVMPSNTTVGAAFGLVTFVIDPLQTTLADGNKLLVMLPTTWLVDRVGFSCRASQTAWTYDTANSTLTLESAPTPAATDLNQTLTLVPASVEDGTALASSTSPLRVFCGSNIRTPASVAAAVTGPYLSVSSSTGAPVAQATAVALPAITASMVVYTVVTRSVTVARDRTLSSALLAAVKARVVSTVGVASLYVRLHSQVVTGADLALTFSFEPYTHFTVDALFQQVSAADIGAAVVSAGAGQLPLVSVSATQTLDLEPTCADSQTTGDESDGDCGHSCIKCLYDMGCLVDTDCESASCKSFRCSRQSNAASIAGLSLAAIVLLLSAMAALF